MIIMKFNRHNKFEFDLQFKTINSFESIELKRRIVRGLAFIENRKWWLLESDRLACQIQETNRFSDRTLSKKKKKIRRKNTKDKQIDFNTRSFILFHYILLYLFILLIFSFFLSYLPQLPDRAMNFWLIWWILTSRKKRRNKKKRKTRKKRKKK